MTQIQEPKSPPWQAGTRLIAGVILILFVGWLLYSVRQLATPLILAVFLAYLLHPLVTRLVAWTKMPRWLAVLIFYLILLGVMMGATTGLGLVVSDQITGVIEDLQNLGEIIPEKLEELQTQIITIGPWKFDLNQINISPIIEQLSSTLQPLLLGTGTILASAAGTAASVVGVLLLVLVFGFYLLLDYTSLDDAFLNLIPENHYEDIRALGEETGKVWQAFLRGQLLLGIVIGSIVAIVLSIIGVKFALGLGLIAGLLEFVPIFGPIISGIIAALVAFFQDGNWLGLTPFGFALVVIIIFVIIQQLENNILVPRIIGHSLNLNPMIVLLAALAGGILGGVLGIMLAAPIVATLRIWLGYVYRKVVLLGSEPEPILVPPPHREAPDVVKKIRARFSFPWDRKKVDE